ncbi:hypothetical protein GCM10009733_076600 [Nonomuraea maheshkhaliensis]|uniref:NYN domain-containing protein n=1 Tax=Nonomuraea maheshkhaliensis TaxID=419590 RepID=A0ABP4S5R9_9ACTN
MSGRGGSARQSNLEIKRADVYVDGFNLYHGLRELGRRRLPWLDLRSMITRVLRPDQRLETLDHFTAGVRNDPPGVARQQVYLAAPESVGSRDCPPLWAAQMGLFTAGRRTGTEAHPLLCSPT